MPVPPDTDRDDEVAVLRARLLDLHGRLGDLRAHRDALQREVDGLVERARGFDTLRQQALDRAAAAEDRVTDLTAEADRQQAGIAAAHTRIAALEADRAAARAAVLQVKAGTRYRIGDLIARALRPPFHRLLWLPVSLWRVLRDGRRGGGG